VKDVESDTSQPSAASQASRNAARSSGGTETRTTCPYCGVGCGVIAKRAADGSVAVTGDPEHPANYGRLCAKGSALAETLSLDDRLLHPSIFGRRADWDEALGLVAARFREAIAEHGPGSVAFYVSGQLLTEDYYVANKLMKGFIGTANIDTNSRLCMASSVAGHRRAFGTDTVPGCYEDLEQADLVVLVGSNLAWCHPVLFQRLAAAKEKRGTKIVVIDPRRTATSEIADLHLSLAPGSDVALFNGLLAHLADAGAIDETYVGKHTTGIDSALAAARDMPLAAVARACRIGIQDLRAFYDLFATTKRVVTVYSQGVNQSSSGTDKVNAIINCHLATGRIGRPGMGPFSVTGQPNAMGGREVGGLANMLAAHMDIGVEAHARIVQDFWRSPTIAGTQGLKAVDMFGAVADGRIKAIWIMATNPAVSMPLADTVRAAIAACPFVVVSDATANTDTARLAHVLLPSAAWGEKDGTVTNSERRVSRQRPFLPLPGEVKPDWWQLTHVARRMGFADAFAYETPAEIFAEHAALSGTGDRRCDFDISAYEAIDRTSYDDLSPFQWPQTRQDAAGKNAIKSETRFFADGGFFTPDRRGRFIAVLPRSLDVSPTADKPLVLNTGRIRDQWHTMTRTAKSARLMAHIAEPMIEMNGADANARGLAPASLARISTESGHIVARVQVTDRQEPGRVFVPMHWTSFTASAARVNTLVAGRTDPVSGQPELKFTPVTVEAYPAAWHGFAVATERPPTLEFDYWAVARAKVGWRIELAGAQPHTSWTELARSLFAASEPADDLAYHDISAGQFRCAAFVDGRVAGLLYVSREPVSVSRSWAADQLDRTVETPGDRLRLLAGRAGDGVRDPGPIVCSCFAVGANQISDAVASGRCCNVAEVGVALQAGTNCGSCRTEIQRIIHGSRISKAG